MSSLAGTQVGSLSILTIRWLPSLLRTQPRGCQRLTPASKMPPGQGSQPLVIPMDRAAGNRLTFPDGNRRLVACWAAIRSDEPTVASGQYLRPGNLLSVSGPRGYNEASLIPSTTFLGWRL